MTTRPKPENGHNGHNGQEHETPFQHYHNEHHKRKALKNHLVAAVGEFVGTFMFLFFGLATHLMVIDQASDASSDGQNSSQTVVFISLGYGFSLLVSVWGWYRISGGLFNPAVTLGLVLSKNLPAIRGLFLLPAQLLGGIVAAALVSCMFPGQIQATNTTLSRGTSIVQGLFIEMFLTSLLVFNILMLAAEKSRDTFIAPVGIGLTLFVAELAGVYYTGGSLNPSRSFGPAVVGTSFPGYHWIYWIGPSLGSLLATGYYWFCKKFKYEEVNPGQDDDGRGSETVDDRV